MLNALWMIVILGGIAGTLAALWGRRIEEWFGMAVAVVIAVLYAFALAGAPVAGYQTVRALGVCAFVAAGACAARSREVRARLLTPGAALFVLLLAVAWWAHRGQMYVFQDEFSHWGRAMDRLYKLAVLPSTVPGALDFPSYPPGAALFGCFWSWLGGAFSEGATISAMNVFIMVCFLPLMQLVDWKRWKHALVVALIGLMIPLVFYWAAYQDVYVDALLGSLAAYAFICWFLGDRSSASLAMVCGAAFTLPLVKASGTAIALLALLVMAADLKGQPGGKKRFMALIAPLGCVLVACGSWQAFLTANGIVSEKPLRVAELGGMVTPILGSRVPWHLRYLTKNFFKYLALPQMMNSLHILPLCYFDWAVVMIIAAVALRRRGGARYGRAVWTLLMMTVAYAVMLYFTYLLFFIPTEAASLHSFERYMASIMIAALGALVAILLKHWQEHPLKALPGCLAILAALMLLVSPIRLIQLTFAAGEQIESTQATRAGLNPAAYAVEGLQAGDRVAWLASNGDGINTYRTYACNRYEFMPIELERPLGDTVTATLEDARQALLEGGYAYAYLFDVDERFVTTYGALFENPQAITEKTLYLVERDRDGVLLRRAS